MKKIDLSVMYMDFLKNEGFRPEIDEDGDVSFKFEGGWYVIVIDEEDDTYFRLLYPRFISIKNDEHRRIVLSAIDYTNLNTKVSKCFTYKEEVMATTEIFLPKPDDFNVVFYRCINALQYLVSTCLNKINELEEGSKNG